MGELEEIGRKGWSGKSQLLTGWLCDGLFWSWVSIFKAFSIRMIYLSCTLLWKFTH